MTASCKPPLWIFIVFSLMLVILASPSMAGFKDPLDFAAIEQKSSLDEPFIDSAQSGNNVVVVGPRGLILFSNDEGASWVQAQVPVQSDLVAVDMVSESKGWAVGHDGVILATSDGGANWTKQFDGLMAGKQFISYYRELIEQGDTSVQGALDLTELNYRDGPALPFLDVWFLDELTGFAAGGFGNIVRTDDGGETWMPWMHRIANADGFHLNSVIGIGQDIFIASERGRLFRLDTELQSFEIIETGYDGTFTGVTGAEGLIIAYGLQGTVYRSTDRGDSWVEVTELPRSTINHAFRRDNDQGYVFANQSGALIISDKNLEKFKVIDTGEPANFTSSVEVTDQQFFVTTLQGLAKVSLADQKMISIATRE